MPMTDTVRRRIRRFERRWISNPFERARHQEILLRRLGQIAWELEQARSVDRVPTTSIEALAPAS
jgi:hypothetical protein